MNILLDVMYPLMGLLMLILSIILFTHPNRHKALKEANFLGIAALLASIFCALVGIDVIW